VQNATAAVAFSLAIGISLDDIVAGLEQAVGAKGRLNFIPHKDFLFIDDTYNANPSSMRAAAEVLAQQQGIRVMVTGDIGELGSSAAIEHYKLGRDLVSVKGLILWWLWVNLLQLHKKVHVVRNMVRRCRLS
jgi:UDP-N-acetylmuramyl pentapeptide synthase